jgi:hypothetical protein
MLKIKEIVFEFNELRELFHDDIDLPSIETQSLAIGGQLCLKI